MPPNAEAVALTGVLNEYDEEVIMLKPQKPEVRKFKIMWFNVTVMSYLHITAVYGLYLLLTSAKLATGFHAFACYIQSILGITAGVHRLWSHRSYKAKWPLRLILTYFQTMAYQDAVIHWARDHRVHHKYSDTDADPHSASRGFFFCHMGWLLVKKHPEVIAKGKQIDVSDLLADPILRFQKKYYQYLMLLICYTIPTIIPMYFWNETFVNAFCVNVFRNVLVWHCGWFVNSVAHFFGNKPYDKFMRPCDNSVAKVLALGEGYHNFHHTFPWDYQASELGKYGISISTSFIDLFAKIGWAYDLKAVSPEFIKRRVKRTGDGSHHLWGWGDKDQLKEEYEGAIITHKE